MNVEPVAGTPGRAGAMRRASTVTATAALGLLVIATGASFAGPSWWVLDLLVHFRPHYAGLALGLGAVLFIARRPYPALLAIACLALNAWPLLPYLWAAAPAPPPPDWPRLKLLASNVNAFATDAAPLAALIEREAPHAVLILELTPDLARELEPVLRPFPHRVAAPRRDAFGIGFYSRLPLRAGALVTLGYRDVPAVSAFLRLGGREVALLGVHFDWPMTRASAAGRDTQMRHAPRHLPGAGAAVLLGDLNTTPWSRGFGGLSERTGLRDAALGRGLHATWPSTPGVPGIRIDHCLVSPSLLVAAYRVGPHIGSDHYPLIVELALAPE